MNRKVKIILIAVEVLVLAVLILLGISCQRKWLIITGDGPRFDWYAVDEDISWGEKDPAELDDISDPEPPDDADPSEDTSPPAVMWPSTSESTEPPDSTTVPPESTLSSGLGDTELPPI